MVKGQGAGSEEVILSARDIVVEYRVAGKPNVRAVHGVSFDVRKGETLGLVGESGCGKSSTGRSIIQLPPPTSGEVYLGGERITGLATKQMRPHRRKLQLIFQDPISSLNPRRTAQEIVAEALSLVRHPSPKVRALELLDEVGVDERMAQRRPHELSGGQCQRVSIARALAQEPDVIVCDEPVSALDVSVQAQVLNLLERLKEQHQLSLLFISHDLAVVGNVSDRVAVMYLGRICEIAPSQELYRRPRHHYTDLLVRSIPDPAATREPKRQASEIGKQATVGKGCPFAARCPAATQLCVDVIPELTEVAEGHMTACHHPLS